MQNRVSNQVKKESPVTTEGNLTSSEKKRILLNNIYGVDIDVNAVEVTKLSLLLKCLEGETENSIARQQQLWHERILPTLDNNIKSGNSLIDTDFYSAQLDFGEEKKIKPFSWQKAFPEVFKQGGFNVVIGNPPWGADLSNESLSYLKLKHSSIIVRMVDSYMYFINSSISLLKYGGSFGMIIPSTFPNQSDMKLLRKFIAEKQNLQIVINLGEKVFGTKVLNTSSILVFTKSIPDEKGIVIPDLRDVNVEEKGKTIVSINEVIKSDWLKLGSAEKLRQELTVNNLR